MFCFVCEQHKKAEAKKQQQNMKLDKYYFEVRQNPTKGTKLAIFDVLSAMQWQ